MLQLRQQSRPQTTAASPMTTAIFFSAPAHWMSLVFSSRTFCDVKKLLLGRARPCSTGR
jgi:hypothetical protein